MRILSVEDDYGTARGTISILRAEGQGYMLMEAEMVDEDRRHAAWA
ncbi:MAG: hypothetical protein QF449_09570 [Alphaproteobacteria bacterium]|jgi:hypothetical protein|nr:hypothetical protein [Alphaproteobacteria bacterium]MDP6591174.1 hypothetical protein [Alphaproteobacteria bacterium]MDP6818273.1 hypothetical protein [Alphaproteobacteria bacterium]|tara:strand:+ start:240 stop:377 length:138 start_codon:yes stop_codon:yes gene_type:complete